MEQPLICGGSEVVLGKNTALRVDNVGVKFRMANERVDNVKDYAIKRSEERRVGKECRL